MPRPGDPRHPAALGLLHELCRTRGYRILETLDTRASPAGVRARLASGEEIALKVSEPRFHRSELQALHAWRGSGYTPRCWEESSEVLATEWCAGQPLQSWSSPDPEALRRIGAALAGLHACAPPAERGLIGLPVWLAELHHRTLPALGALQPELASAFRHSYQQLAGRGLGRSVIHGDLHDKNVLLQGTRVRIFDPYGLLGDGAFDLARLAASRRHDGPQVLQGLLRGWQGDGTLLRPWTELMAGYYAARVIRYGGSAQEIQARSAAALRLAVWAAQAL